MGSAALAEELCDEKRFRKYVGGPIVEIRHAVHDALFTAYDDEESWGIAHRICAPLLSSQAVGRSCGEVVDCAEELVQKWRMAAAAVGGETEIESGGRGKGKGDEGIVLLDDLNRLNLEATTLTLFGKKLGCIEAREPHPMLKGMEDSTSEAIKRPTRPGFVNWLFFGSKFRRATRVMREDYAADLVRYRQQQLQQQQQQQQQMTTDDHREDLLTALMEGMDPLTGKALTESQVIDEIVSMPIGSSTAPCLVASAVYFLLRNPECIDVARRELDEVLGPRKGAEAGATGTGADTGADAAGTGAGATSNNGGDTSRLGVSHLSRLPYIEGIVRESLRLSAAAPGFNIEPIPRKVDGRRGDGDDGGLDGPVTAKKGQVDKSPILLAGGKYQVAYNQAMIIVLPGVNRDPAVFEDPLQFRPERMMGDAFEALPDGVKKWYGNGKRECIGKHWAWQFNMAVIAVLIREVDFEMVDPSYEMVQDGWFNIRPVGFKVRVKPRPL